jgi:hypothetical protein
MGDHSGVRLWPQPESEIVFSLQAPSSFAISLLRAERHLGSFKLSSNLSGYAGIVHTYFRQTSYLLVVLPLDWIV